MLGRDRTLASRQVWRTRPFDVIQACNPPDTYWALARLWRRRGVQFVFDQHDLNPELFLSRFGVPHGLLAKVQYRGLAWLELRTYRDRRPGHLHERVLPPHGDRARSASTLPHVTVVRSGPDTARMRPFDTTSQDDEAQDAVDTARQLVYLGIMGPQDGVDVLLDAMDQPRAHPGAHRRPRCRCSASATASRTCERRRRELGLDAHVTFTGRADRKHDRRSTSRPPTSASARTRRVRSTTSPR